MSANNPDELLNTSDDLLYQHVYETSKSLDRAEKHQHSNAIVRRIRKISSPGFWSKRSRADAIDSSQPQHAAEAPTAESPQKTVPGSTLADAPQLIPAVGRPTAPEEKKRRLRWISFAAVSTLTIALAVAVLVLRPLAKNETPLSLHPTLRNETLGLQIEGKGGGILVGWNRLNPIVRSASAGILQIDDGTQHRQIHLDPEQVAGGSVLYMPSTDDVTFRLELRGPRGEATTDSTRVLNGHKASNELGASKLGLDTSEEPEAGSKNSASHTGLAKPPGHDDPGPRPAPPVSKPAQIAAVKAPLNPSPVALRKPAQTRPIVPPPANPAPAYAPPKPSRQVMPNQVPQGIASTLEIRVQVKLDRNGQVETARLVNQAANLPPDLAASALTAAKQWTFSPATLGGTPVDGDYLIVFRIRATAP